ncbi:histone-lysine N-methyltransferase SETMAR [Trichonephila clavata]|uniref:Histone-lysine N-methyltransferase SETMAR n=1 Tax=Trichonephila clavata TaxID=2740835 RepID=A0A8X6KZY5_TRICU|nr:histone-lysine N-methyltransferase SETMAR [Trichonephila clavata]
MSLRTMVQHGKRKRPLLRNGFLLHHDNVEPHIAHCVLYVLQQSNVEILTHNAEILTHPPYTPDLSPCDFWPFPQRTISRQTFCKQQSMRKGCRGTVEKALIERTFTCF